MDMMFVSDCSEQAKNAAAFFPAPPPGFEPGPDSSKDCSAAVTPRRNAPSRKRRPPILPDASSARAQSPISRRLALPLTGWQASGPPWRQELLEMGLAG